MADLACVLFLTLPCPCTLAHPRAPAVHDYDADSLSVWGLLFAAAGVVVGVMRKY